MAQLPKDSTQNKGYFSGSFQTDIQRYETNSAGQFIENRWGANTFLQLNYHYKNIRAGVRGEGYTPALIGFSSTLKGVGVANRFVSFRSKKWETTLGNFYEQIGNGLIFRATEQRFLGIDTSVDGVLAKFFARKISSKVFAGKQRIGFKKSDGLLFGIDNELIISELTSVHFLKIGLGAINKYENYDGILGTIRPNVWAVSSRVNYNYKSFDLNAEYAHKTTDPSVANGYISRFGRGLYITSSLSAEKLSFVLYLKRTENMDYRSQRGESLTNALINYIPNTTKQQSYRLLTLYPYASQAVLGEAGGQVEISYSTPKGGLFSFSSTAMNGLKKYFIDDVNYTTRFWEIGNEIYFRNAALEHEKKWTKKISSTILIDYTQFNKGVILGGKPELVTAFTVVTDATLRVFPKNSVRIELQHLSTPNDLGNWAMALAEVSFAKGYYLFFSDEINYHQFPVTSSKHYYNVGTSFSRKSHRILLSYGNVREGLLCVGGICRITPAYQGFNLSILSSF